MAFRNNTEGHCCMYKILIFRYKNKVTLYVYDIAWCG